MFGNGFLIVGSGHINRQLSILLLLTGRTLGVYAVVVVGGMVQGVLSLLFVIGDKLQVRTSTEDFVLFVV